MKCELEQPLSTHKYQLSAHPHPSTTTICLLAKVTTMQFAALRRFEKSKQSNIYIYIYIYIHPNVQEHSKASNMYTNASHASDLPIEPYWLKNSSVPQNLVRVTLGSFQVAEYTQISAKCTPPRQTTLGRPPKGFSELSAHPHPCPEESYRDLRELRSQLTTLPMRDHHVTKVLLVISPV